jgi:putative ABC transport system ATP-binding protein
MNHDTSQPLVRTRALERRYDVGAGHVHVLRQIGLEVAAGEFVTIMGPSGAGKTTLLSILGMLDHEWDGEYWLAGEPVHQLKPKQRMALSRAHIGFVFQQYHLLDDLTVAENLDVPLSYRDVPRAERQALVADTLDRFGMVGKKDLFPSQLSGGQQQLVGVARAVIASPSLILADEPTGSLHTRQGREIMELFRQLNTEGTTIIQVTHDEDWAAYGSRIIELEDGWVLNDRATTLSPGVPVGAPAPRASDHPRGGRGLALGLALTGMLALASALGPARADAQQATLPAAAPPAADTIRLDDAVRTALGTSPELRQAEARAAMAGAGRWDAWGRLLPSVTAWAGATERGTLQRTTEDPFTGGIVLLPDSLVGRQETYSTGAGLSLNWMLLEGGQRYWHVRRARRDADAGQLALEAARARVAAGATLAYLDALEAEAQRRVRAAEVERGRALSEAAQARLDVGEAPEIDVLQARLATSDAELALLEAEAAAEAARLALMEYLGPDWDPDMVLIAPARTPDGGIPADDELRRCALEASADLAALEAQVASARMNATAAGWAFLPTVRVGVEWARSEFGATRSALTLEPRNERTDYTLVMSWAPLSQPGRWVGDRQRARASEAEARAALAARRPAIVREVEVALGRVRRARLLEDRSALNLELAARQREQAAERYRLGVAPITETIQAEALAREAERQGVTAEFARRRAIAELERAAAIRLDDPMSPCGAMASRP